MGKNIVICLDGTNNELKAAVNTNVVRLFSMLDLKDPARQVGYDDPGVGTFSSPSRDGLAMFSWALPGEARSFPAPDRETAIEWLAGT